MSRVQPTSQACLDLGMRKSTRKEAKGRSLLQTQFPKESSGMQCLLPRDLLVEATGIASWRIMILEVAIEKLSCIMPTLDSDSKESPCNVGDPGLIPGLGRSTREGKSHGQRSLVGYSLWGYKESDMTEQLTLSLFFFFMPTMMENLHWFNCRTPGPHAFPGQPDAARKAWMWSMDLLLQFLMV